MKDIFNEKILNVTEDGATYQYFRRFDNNHLPNYYPDENKIAINLTNKLDEVLFLPIEKEDFDPHRNTYVFGYRYSIFYRQVPSPDQQGPTFQIAFEIRRIRYEVTDVNSIIINKVYDPVHIPRILQVTNNNTSNVGASITMNMIMNMLSENNQWYLDKQI